ncbi:MAG: hypothetical protein U0263_06575 [Polyangiaceae bacterium]
MSPAKRPQSPDARLERAEVPRQPVVEAAAFTRRRLRGRPYHEPIADDLLEDLHLAIGKGLALVQVDEDAEPEVIVEAIAACVDDVRAARQAAPTDPADAALALACLYGQAVARALGWGWAHVRCTRRPGILLVSPQARYVTGPRAVLDAAFERGGSELTDHFGRIGNEPALPASAPGRYLLVR